MYPNHPRYSVAHSEEVRETQPIKQRENLLRVTGEGMISVAPDQTVISVGVITENERVGVAQQENAEAISSIISSMRLLGISDEQIQTETYRIEPLYDYVDGQQVFRSYRVTHLLETTIQTIELTGQVIDQAVQSGANSIGYIQFTLRDPQASYNEALREAVENAREKAEVLARSLEVTLFDPPLRMIEQSTVLTPVSFRTELYTTAVSTPIQSGQIEIKAVVEAEFTYS